MRLLIIFLLFISPLPALADYVWDLDLLRSRTQVGGSISLLAEGREFAKPERWYLDKLAEVKNKISNQAGVYPKFLISSSGERNAYATMQQGQAVIIFTLPMLRACGNDFDAIAAIVGHEVAHLKLDHSSSKALVNGILDVLAGIAIGALDAKLGGNRFQGVARESVNIVENLASKTYSRAAEFEADKYGVLYMLAAGYDPEGAVRVHRNIIPADASYFATHPSSDDRIDGVRRVAYEAKSKSGEPVSSVSSRYAAYDYHVPPDVAPIPDQVGVVLLAKSRLGYFIFSGAGSDELKVGDAVYLLDASGQRHQTAVSRSVDGYYSALIPPGLGSVEQGDRLVSR